MRFVSDSLFVARRTVAIRPLALPVEHGGWAFLLEPIVLGLLVAPSHAGVLIACGAIATFLVRHPLKLAMHDWTRRRYPRTGVCEALAAAYASIGALLFLAAWTIAGPGPLLVLAFAIPFGFVQFAYDIRHGGRSLPAEIAGAVAPAACAAAIAVAGKQSLATAAMLSVLVLCRAIPAVLYVRTALRGERRALMLAAHAIAIAAAAFSSWLAAVSMTILFARALPDRRELTPQRAGIRELGWGVVTIAVIAISYRL